MELKGGEVTCPECNGSGNRAKWNKIPDYGIYLECKHCHGTGKLDWIEAVVGKKATFNMDTIRVRDYGIVVKPNSSIIISGNIA